MKLAIITESWPTLGIDSIYLNKAFIEIANTIDTCIYTTSQNGYGTITGQNNILIHRIESVPHKACTSFIDKVSTALQHELPDIIYNISLNYNFNVNSKKKIAHWVTGSIIANSKMYDDYDTHITVDPACKTALIDSGVLESKIVIATPSTISNMIKSSILNETN